jgi:aminoglycoside phosphotransferase (APT) family kinase protein
VFAKYRVLPADKISLLRTILNELETREVKPSLTHGDLRLKNIIVDDDGQITAIIDWDDCLSTMSPEWELSIALHDMTVDEKNAFIDGYGFNHSQIEGLASVMRFFNIMNYSNVIEIAGERNEVKALNDLKLRLNGSLDLYSL